MMCNKDEGLFSQFEKAEGFAERTKELTTSDAEIAELKKRIAELETSGEIAKDVFESFLNCEVPIKWPPHMLLRRVINTIADIALVKTTVDKKTAALQSRINNVLKIIDREGLAEIKPSSPISADCLEFISWIRKIKDILTADSSPPPQPTREAELLEIIERTKKKLGEECDPSYSVIRFLKCVIYDAKNILAEAEGKEQADAETD